jgi:hypothetical protein
MNAKDEKAKDILKREIELNKEKRDMIIEELSNLRNTNKTHMVMVIFDGARAYRDCELGNNTFEYDGQKKSIFYDTVMTDPGYPKILIKKKSGKYIFIGQVLVNERVHRDISRIRDPQPSYILKQIPNLPLPVNLISKVFPTFCPLTKYHVKLKMLLEHGLIPDNVESLDEGMVKCRMVV